MSSAAVSGRTSAVQSGSSSAASSAQASSSTSTPSSSSVSSTASARSSSASSSGPSSTSTRPSTSSSASSSASSSSSSSSTLASSSTPISSIQSSSSSVSKASAAAASTSAGTVISASNDNASTTKSGLSGGAIGGIVGGIVGVLALGLLGLFIWKAVRRRRDKKLYPLPAPRNDTVFTGAPVAGEKERPDIAKRNNHESFHSLYAPSLPSYYPNYNRRISSANPGMTQEPWSASPQPAYMTATTESSPSTASQRLQHMSSHSSMALAAEARDGLRLDTSGRVLPTPIQTAGLAPPAGLTEPGGNISRKSSRSTMLFPHIPLSPSMNSMSSTGMHSIGRHSTGYGNTPHSGRRITLTMPMPLDPSTNIDGYLPHSRTSSVSEFGQMYGGPSSPASTNRRTRDSRRSLQPYHQGHLSPHFPNAADELASIPGVAVPISSVAMHHNQSSISTITAPSGGPSRSGSGSAGSTSGGGASDSEALMISTAKGKQVDWS